MPAAGTPIKNLGGPPQKSITTKPATTEKRSNNSTQISSRRLQNPSQLCHFLVRNNTMASKKTEEKKEEYRNEGLLRWERLRLEWRKPDPNIPKKSKSAKTIDPEDIIERIFSHAGNGVLPEPIPLPQMIDILIDFWEADGLYD